MTLSLTFTEPDGDVLHTTTVQREAESLTRTDVLGAVEDLLRGAGFHCPPGSVVVMEAGQ